MGAPMRIRVQRDGSAVQLRVLMAHEMETGQRRDAAGQVIAAWFIQQVSVHLDGVCVLRADWGPAVSKNPFLQVTLDPVAAAQRIAVQWTDNRDDQRTEEISAP